MGVFLSKKRNRKYSKELKLKAVQIYLNGERRYEIFRKEFKKLSAAQLKCMTPMEFHRAAA